jgi:hypothetical protein
VNDRRVGFVIDGLLPNWRDCLGMRCNPLALLRGVSSNSSVGYMRFGWIADYVNRNNMGVLYELFRPWRSYDAVVFLKSMGSACEDLLANLKTRGTKCIFDVNVDYLTPAQGNFYYNGMAPTEMQRMDSLRLVRDCDGIIADSSHLAKVARHNHGNVVWIPDNVRDDLIHATSEWRPRRNERLVLLWSGQLIKMFELLKIKDVLIEYSSRLQLRIITNGTGIPDAWYETYKREFGDLLKKVNCEFITFKSIEALLDVYDTGGIFISPRFLDNSYNLGHTEWKISLAMARGRFVLCSEQPSYMDVDSRAEHRGIRICRTNDDWRNAFENIFADRMDWHTEQKASEAVIRRYYSTSVIGSQHAEYITKFLS